jgi:Tfp pilus assembly protein PilF
MSVINTMLKDLERRGVECDKSDNNILGGLSANKHAVSEQGLSGNVYFISLLSIFSILAIVVTIYYLSPYKMVSVAQEKVEKPLASNISSNIASKAEYLKIETQTNNKSALIQQNKVAAEKPVVAQSVPAPITSSRPASTPIKSRVVIAKQETQPPAKTIQTDPVVQRSNKQSSDTEKSVAEEKQQQIKPAVIKPVFNVRPTVTQETVLAETEDFDEAAETSETLQVVSKKQRDYTPQEKSRQAYTTASSLYNQGDKQQAKTSLKEALAYDSTNINACSLLAVIYLEDGRADLASDVIENGLSKHTNDQALLRLYLQSLVQQAKYKEAITVMERRLRLTSPEDLGYLAGLYQKQNDHLNAVKFYARALQLKPSTSLWWIGQGISLEVIEKYDEALQSYQQSISTGQLSGKLAQYATSRINTIKQLHADFVS